MLGLRGTEHMDMGGLVLLAWRPRSEGERRAGEDVHGVSPPGSQVEGHGRVPGLGGTGGLRQGCVGNTAEPPLSGTLAAVCLVILLRTLSLYFITF